MTFASLAFCLFLQNPATPTKAIVKEVVLPIPPEKAWTLWADSQGATSYGVPQGANIELVPGGKYEIYFSKDMQNHHGGVVLVGGHIYGCSNSLLHCVEFATGKLKWRDRSVGKGAVTFADGHLYLLSENNVAGLVVATPDGYQEKGRFSIPDQGWPSWAHPVVSDARLYLRNQSWLACYDIKAK